MTVSIGPSDLTIFGQKLMSATHQSFTIQGRDSRVIVAYVSSTFGLSLSTERHHRAEKDLLRETMEVL